ncbi:MAG: biopolymer transporter ExbD [Gammaproteobacteria bacterium]
MKQSRRAIRMERNHKRQGQIPGLNLVSLMDIFTILVFFLLVNSSDGEVLPTTRNIELPESIAEQKPRQNIVVMISGTDILVQGSRVATMSDVRENSDYIDPLINTLKIQHAKHLLPTTSEKQAAQEITIMGSKDIPYKLLKKVMRSCTEAGYERISLAVLQKAAQDS